jgi:hypothetical protein
VPRTQRPPRRTGTGHGATTSPPRARRRISRTPSPAVTSRLRPGQAGGLAEPLTGNIGDCCEGTRRGFNALIAEIPGVVKQSFGVVVVRAATTRADDGGCGGSTGAGSGQVGQIVAPSRRVASRQRMAYSSWLARQSSTLAGICPSSRHPLRPPSPGGRLPDSWGRPDLVTKDAVQLGQVLRYVIGECGLPPRRARSA